MSSPRVPPADIRRNKKDEVQQTLVSMAKVGEKVADLIHRDHSIASASADLTQPIKFALNLIPEERKMNCIIDLLRVAEMYRKGVIPIIRETNHE